MNRSVIITTIGFLLLMTGFMSFVLKVVGVHLSWLYWLESLGGLTAMIIRVILIFLGIILIYMSRTPMDA